MISEDAWQKASWFDDFRQSVPHFNEPATEYTRVAFLHDAHNIYVAVYCEDSAPEEIRANKLRHRDHPSSDDHVQIVFDTYRDEVRGTVFVVNPHGSKEEGLSNGYHRYTWSWDEVWDVKTRITERGWQAEFRIPLRLLRYGSESRQEWGVNVQRAVKRKQEESYLSAPPPPFEISALNYAGVLTGLNLGERQRNLQVIPYGLVGAVRETDEESGKELSDSIGEFGFDVKYSITSDLTLDATYNTDFAQVESDSEQVNLTRFSLFYPEKREFFLENAQLFEFGHSGGPQGWGPDVSPFFSRRIGLHEGQTVPIDGGLRLTGKVGKQDIGLISVRTAPLADLDLDRGWYNIARVRRDLGGRSYVGGIVTDSSRNGLRSNTIGVDGEWFLTETLLVRGDFLRVDDNQQQDSHNAYSVAMDLTTDPWGFLVAYRVVDEDFEPDLGFVRRNGYRKSDASFRYSFRPEKWGVRRVSFRTFNNWYDSLEHRDRESIRNSMRCELELENGDRLDLSFNRNFEQLFDAFDLDDELSFAVGEYWFDSQEFSYSSDSSRRWGFNASLTTGEFFDGDRDQTSGSIWFVFNRHLRASGSYSSFDISSNHGGLDWNLWTARLNYTHSSTLSASSFVQYNSSTGTTVLNLRLRKILRNDSDLYIVFNQREFEDDTFGTLREHDAAVKISYRFFL
jgi:hypothetical protein